MDKLVEWTNKYTELHPSNDAGEKLQARLWQLICKEELWVYFSVLIYIGLTQESSIKDYWGSLDTTSSEYIVKKYIGWVQFEQLNYYFQCIELQLDNNPTPQSIFNRVNKLAEHIWLIYRKLYNLGTHLAVNKMIKYFMGYILEIINIPSKLTPEGFKI